MLNWTGPNGDTKMTTKHQTGFFKFHVIKLVRALASYSASIKFILPFRIVNIWILGALILFLAFGIKTF